VSDAAAARWVARAWTLLAATSALYFLADNEADNDLWVHLFSGRLILAAGVPPRVDDLSYTAAGLPWVDHEWLTQVAFAGLFEVGGAPALWLTKVAVALLTAWCVWRSVAARASSWWVRGAILVLVFATLARGYAVRPQIITYLGVAALLGWLDRLDTGRRLPAWAIMTVVAIGFALWANAHGGFIFGVGMLALFALGSRHAPAGASRSLRLAMLVVAAAAACLNPYGPALFTYIASELSAPHPLTEWQPVPLADPAHLPFLVLLGAWVATLPFSHAARRQPWRAVLVAITALMALRHQRHTPLLALCAAAPLAEQVEATLAWVRARTRFQLSATATIIVALAVTGLAAAQVLRLAQRVWLARAGIVYAAAEYPVGALRFVRESGATGNVALPLDWGGYTLWHGAPAVRVSLDGRFATVYPPRVVEDNFAFFRGDTGGSRLLDSYATTLVLVPRGVSTPLDDRPDWRLLYTDSVASLFAKSGTAAAAASEAAHGWLPFP
jgi:hypothetical protein